MPEIRFIDYGNAVFEGDKKLGSEGSTRLINGLKFGNYGATCLGTIWLNV